jgi:hypothetical protein
MRGKIQIFLLAMVGFTACEEKSAPTPPDVTTDVKVYFASARGDAQTLTLYAACDTLIALAGARYDSAQSPVGVALTASFAIGSDSLVAAYNARNSAEYLPFPEGVATLPQATAVIPATGFASPALEVRINDGGSLEGGKTYLLPVLMTGVTGALPVDVDKDYATAYVVVAVVVTQDEGTWKQGKNGKHGEYRLLHRHTDESVKSIPIVIIGDGFAAADNKNGGAYERVCGQLKDKFLSNPIIRDFKGWFDVYAVVAESRTSRVIPGDDRHPGFFNSGVDPDFGRANELAAAAIPGLASKATRAFIFVGHGMIGGYALFGTADGMGWAVFSTDEGDVSGYWMAHEFVGHGFAALADEYSSGSGYGGPAALQSDQAKGMLLNISFTSDPKAVPWKDFIGLSGYEEVGVFEGGFGQPTGIWRPEKWSIMLDNYYGSEGDAALYYTAMSRWILYQTIHRRAGKQPSWREFLVYDKAYNVK